MEKGKKLVLTPQRLWETWADGAKNFFGLVLALFVISGIFYGVMFVIEKFVLTSVCVICLGFFWLVCTAVGQKDASMGLFESFLLGFPKVLFWCFASAILLIFFFVLYVVSKWIIFSMVAALLIIGVPFLVSWDKLKEPIRCKTCGRIKMTNLIDTWLYGLEDFFIGLLVFLVLCDVGWVTYSIVYDVELSILIALVFGVVFGLIPIMVGDKKEKSAYECWLNGSAYECWLNGIWPLTKFVLIVVLVIVSIMVLSKLIIAYPFTVCVVLFMFIFAIVPVMIGSAKLKRKVKKCKKQ